MGRYTKEDIFRMVDEEDVEFIRLQFSDIFGMTKNLAVTVSQLERTLNNEYAFDPSAINGFEDIGQEIYLKPDLDTFEIYPWRPQTGKVARMFCDLLDENGKPFGGDSRRVLRDVLDRASEMGFIFDIRPELEFFLFHTDEEGRPTTITHEDAGYYDVAPLDLAENVRRDIILTLEDMNFQILGSHHEISPAQHEIDFVEDRADRVADAVMTFKMAVKTIAKKHGLYATFLPKPTEGVNGSGMHVNVFCRDHLGKNLFRNDEDEILSETGKQFVAGLLAHSRAITLLTNPIVNSYKRLIPGFDAPTDITWSDNLAARSAVINVPHRSGDSTRIEYRSPDGVCNPYLAFAAIIAAGLDGIQRGLKAPEMENRAPQADTVRPQHLPETLGEAMEAYEKDALIRDVLGDYIYNRFRDEKMKEWKEFRSVVTNWELDRYLGRC
jgi:glutamine synthetase